MTKEAIYERRRRKRTITLSEEADTFLHESVTNASRFLESLILGAKTGINPVLFTISQKEHGLAEIRTQDLRHVKATSGKNTGLNSPDENSSEESCSIPEEAKTEEHSRNGRKIETLRDYYLSHKKDFISFLKSEKVAEGTIKDYSNALENLKPISNPPDIARYQDLYGVSITDKIKKGVYALLRYVKIRHASSTLLGYDHELWRIQFTTKAQSNEGERSSSRVKDLTAEEIREGCSRLNPSLQTFFKFLVFTGMRAEQAYDVLKSWKPEKVERFTRTIEGEKIAYARYATSDFSRGKKNSFYAIFPAALLKEIEGYTLPGAVDSITLQIRTSATQDKTRPINASNLRKFNINMLRKEKAVDPDVAEYIQGRRPKGVGADRYISLKDLAVEQYPIALHRNFGPDFFRTSAAAPPKKQTEKAPSTKGTPAPAPAGSLNALWKETADGFMQYCRQNQIGVINRPKQAPYYAHVGEGNSCFRKNTILSPADFAALKGNFNKLPKSYRTALRLWIKYLSTIGITSPAGYPAEEWIAVLTYAKN